MEHFMRRTMSACCCLILLSLSVVFAENQSGTSALSITTDLAYYPEAQRITGSDHFSPTVGPFAGAEARATLDYSYTIPVPFSDNPLLKGNKLKLGASLEISPVSIMPIAEVSFTPIAFLVFNAGGKIGSGWDFSPLNVQGLALYNSSTKEYDSVDPFSNWFYTAWFEGVFQFDIAALMPGDWNHIVAVATYKLLYEGITSGGENGAPWLWQGVGAKANGLQYVSNVILAYQMPLKLQTVGVQCEFEGYFSSDSYAAAYSGWDPAFMKIAFSPIANIQFNDKHSLLIQLRVKSRRAFESEYTSDDNELDQVRTGREWYFDRIAFSYTCKL